MSIEKYESMLKTNAAILEAENEYARNEQLHNARSIFDSLRRKQFA